MRAAMKAAIQYAKDRKVFGAPLIDYPLTQVKIAPMAARFAACRQLAYAVGRQLDSGGGRMEASLVKLLACRSAEMVTREALQIHGGMGYAEETRGQPLLRRRARAVDLRGRRGDARAEGGRAHACSKRRCRRMSLRVFSTCASSKARRSSPRRSRA